MDLKRIFARRRYMHFDEPVSPRVARAFATNPQSVVSWSFLPLLNWVLSADRVKRHEDGSLKPKQKNRPICYAAHKDAAIYAYYGAILVENYEQELQRLGLAEAVTAFRLGSGKCNINFAAEAFDWIRSHPNCLALAFDIEAFFNNLDHQLLKQQWARTIRQDRLPSDHYAVYRSLTRFAYVDRLEALNALGISQHNIRSGNRRRLCDPETFRLKIRGGGLIRQNPKPCGIPQGSPMSAVLSNIYLLDFDTAVAAKAKALGGLYRRYCDDMLCVVDPAAQQEVEAFVANEIQKVKLKVQTEKTGRHRFQLSGGRILTDKPLKYLGFTFDGERILLRNAAISRYYSRMRAGIALAVQTMRRKNRIRAQHGEAPSHLRRRKLQILYTYLGRHNFPAYVYRAASILNEPAVKRQIRRHPAKLARGVARAIRRQVPSALRPRPAATTPPPTNAAM
jgi:RNA-directed DNA polymerase